MKAKKFLMVLSALAAGAVMLAISACGGTTPGGTTPGGDDPSGTNPGGTTPGGTNPGGDGPSLPTVSAHYVTNADVLQDGDIRWQLYTTNETSGEEDSVLAIRKGEKADDEWAYGDQTIVIRGEEDGWDEYIGSGALVKGTFAYGGEDYNWMIAYSATSRSDGRQNHIGLALAETPDGEWTKVGETAVLEFDASVYGNMNGLYAPSLVNPYKDGRVRLFYTRADAFGHYACFVDIDATNVDELAIAGEVQVPTNGEIAGADTETMFPNGDFAFDAESGLYYSVKDYSPAAADIPNFATRIQLLSIAEEELYSIEELNGWHGIKTWDSVDIDDEYQRLYGACVVSDAYGHIDGATSAEVIFNVCATEDEDEEWLFTQKLMTLSVSF